MIGESFLWKFKYNISIPIIVRYDRENILKINASIHISIRIFVYYDREIYLKVKSGPKLRVPILVYVYSRMQIG